MQCFTLRCSVLRYAAKRRNVPRDVAAHCSAPSVKEYLMYLISAAHAATRRSAAGVNEP